MNPRCCSCAAGLLALLLATPAWGQVALDFEGEALGDGWEATGPIEAQRLPVPEPAEGGPRGHGVRLRAEGRSLFATRRDRSLDLDWGAVEALSFWVRGDARSPVLEVWLGGEAIAAAGFWRRVPVRAGWQEVRLPLRWFRADRSGVRLRWGDVRRLGFLVRGAGEVWLDDVRVIDEPDGPGARIGVDDLRALVAPQAAAAARVWTGANVRLVSDAPQLDLEELGAHLDRVAAALREELPAPDGGGEPLPVLVMADRAGYRALGRRLGAALAADGEAPDSDGWTVEGIASSWFAAEQGSIRPALTHELVHAYLEQRHRLVSAGDWLHEGLATRVQLRFHGQDITEIVTRGLSDPVLHDPLQAVCDGRRISQSRYWQAATVLDTLLADDPRAVVRLLALARERGSTDLRAYLEARGSSFALLEAAWRRRCRSRYGAR